MNQAQGDTLSALPYAVGNEQYYPGFSPTSGLVRRGLMEPFPVHGVGFDPQRPVRALQDKDQIAADLAMIRSLAGY